MLSGIISPDFMKSRKFEVLGQDTLQESEKFEDKVATILVLFIVAPMILVMIAVYGFAYLVECVAAQSKV